ncbi:hypothetical protein [Laspinema olomoucense]|uniref:hypothetical protein n=1 Tax=Laspinema olomoucense TaxID=3231600 RepID=UPI0021BA8421|nr:hypothetical protein [Laspinema sp. D3d]MCT7971152.1 hypothetical protein [Laspinema sp. D3d]
MGGEQKNAVFLAVNLLTLGGFEVLAQLTVEDQDIMQRIREKVKNQDKSIPKWIDQAVDVSSVATRLQGLGMMDVCQHIPQSDVEYAFAQWFKSMVNSIEEDPEWFIQKFDSQAFQKHIPCLDELDRNESDDLVPPQTIDKSSLLIC